MKLPYDLVIPGGTVTASSAARFLPASPDVGGTVLEAECHPNSRFASISPSCFSIRKTAL